MVRAKVFIGLDLERYYVVFHWGYGVFVQCAAKGLDLLRFTFPFDFPI